MHLDFAHTGRQRSSVGNRRPCRLAMVAPRLPLEAPWDRLDVQDQQAIEATGSGGPFVQHGVVAAEAYCSDLDRILSMSATREGWVKKTYGSGWQVQ